MSKKDLDGFMKYFRHAKAEKIDPSLLSAPKLPSSPIWKGGRDGLSRLPYPFNSLRI